MNPPPARRGEQLQGAARLATEATAGLVDLVEAMHERVARLPGWPAPTPSGRTKGITGLVYKSIRGVTHVVGGSVDALLGLLTPALSAGDHPGPDRDAIVAALNGVLGDHLAATGNPLATPMSFRREGQALPLTHDALAAALPEAQPGLLLMVHGLCMNDLQWRRDGHDHGAVLAPALGLTPVYLRYNSGAPIAANGRALADALETLVAQWPRPLARLIIVGHSMGGLVARSALHQATTAVKTWPKRLSDLVFLGTPHHGAPLERAGHGVDLLLGATPYTAPFARLGRLRSAGITDLRHGYLTDPPQPLPLPNPRRVRCFAIAGSLGAEAGTVKERLLGDGLVPLDSALGRHADPQRALAFAPDHVWVVRDTNHMQLLSRPEVAAQISRWLDRGAGAVVRPDRPDR